MSQEAFIPHICPYTLCAEGMEAVRLGANDNPAQDNWYPYLASVPGVADSMVDYKVEDNPVRHLELDNGDMSVEYCMVVQRYAGVKQFAALQEHANP